MVKDSLDRDTEWGSPVGKQCAEGEGGSFSAIQAEKKEIFGGKANVIKI